MSAGQLAGRVCLVGGAVGFASLALAGLLWVGVAVGYAAYSLWDSSAAMDAEPAAPECVQCGCRSECPDRCEVCGAERFAGRSW